MPLDFHALWLLCGLGAVVFASITADVRSIAVGVTAFVTVAAWGGIVGAPSAPVLGLASALAACTHLLRPRWWLPGAFLAGGLSATWGTLLAQQGAPVGLALGIAPLLPVSTWWAQSRHAGFAPAGMRDEALLATAVTGLCTAALPGVAEGWRTAVALSGGGASRVGAAGAGSLGLGGTDVTGVPLWVFGAGTAALFAGGAYCVWSRR